MEHWLPIVISLLFSAFFSGIEIAFAASNKLKIEVDKSRNLFSAQILSKFIKRPTLFVSTLWLGNIISLVVYAIYTIPLIDKFLLTSLPAFTASTGVFLILEILIAALIYLLLADFLPKILFRLGPDNLLNALAVPVYAFYLLFYPVVRFFIGFSEVILQYLFRVKINKKEYTFSTVDLENFLNESTLQPSKENDDYQEIQMFQNARDLSNIKVRDCMVPRNEIVAISREDTIENLGSLIVESGHSKILVFDQSIDNIIGYSHSYDIFGKPDTIDQIIKPVIIVPGTMAVDHLLHMFIKERKSVALVVDEFGGTDGMLTIEDIMEEIFGNIEDEYDVEELEDKQLNDNEYLVSGRHTIDYLNEKYNLELPESDDYKTLAGYIIHFHENIPAQSEEIVIGNYNFTILKATDTRIEQVLIRLITD